MLAEWTQGRRHTLNGARHRVLFKLVDLYIKDERVGLAEELLFAALEEDPTDEDALCRLMVLLVEQERRQEALHLYQYTEDVIREELDEPAVYTRELARRVRLVLVLRDGGVGYTAQGTQTAAPAGRVVQFDRWSDHGDGFGVQRARLAVVADPGGVHLSSSFHYRPLRRRARRRAALPGR